ncbi:MAG: tetratricopeptide repeat protein [Cypionkella sp.]
MKALRPLANGILAAVLLFVAGIFPVFADAKRLDDLFQQLHSATDEEAGAIAQNIWLEWSKSGSASMDLLLRRGEEAMAAGDPKTAIEHLTALIDHAPDFPEGYNARATAYYQIGQYGLSIADIARTLSLNPRHFGALAGLGRIFEQLNEPDKALEVYREALKINPHMKNVQDAMKRLDAKLGGQEL